MSISSTLEADQIFCSTRTKMFMRLEDPENTFDIFLRQNAKQLYSALLPRYPARYEYMIDHYMIDRRNKSPCGIEKLCRFKPTTRKITNGK